MIRKVITPDNQNIFIHLPEDYVGKKVEVIAFIVDEVVEKPYGTDDTVTHFASEPLLAKDWLSPEEDKAWRDL